MGFGTFFIEIHATFRPFSGRPDDWVAKDVDGRFRCLHCSSLFQQKYNAVRHYREMHMQESLIRCKYCDGKFKRIDHLKSHMKRWHAMSLT